MSESRRFNRLEITDIPETMAIVKDEKKQIRIIDVSAGGMKFSSVYPVEIGTFLSARISITPGKGDFYVKGNVNRVEGKEGFWEAAVKFNKISTKPFLSMHMFQIA